MADDSKESVGKTPDAEDQVTITVDLLVSLLEEQSDGEVSLGATKKP